MGPRELAESITELASLPGACVRIMELADNPLAGADALAEVVTLDPGLAARLLRLVNSAYYARPAPVDDLATSVRVVGTEALRNLAFAAGAISAFRGIPTTLVDMDSFWNASVHCGLLARALGRIARQPVPDRMFAGGLLHGVGQLVLYAREPERSRAMLDRLQRGEGSRAALERGLFGFTHAAVGAALLEAWRLPTSLIEPVRWQLEPRRATEFAREAALLHIAQAITETVEPDVKREARVHTPERAVIDAAVWTQSGLVNDVLSAALDEVDAQWFEVIQILSPRALAY